MLENSEPQTYKGIYAMHKYWSRKPHNLVAEYISRFSNLGDVILDPFCGSGVTIIEGLSLNRRMIGLDINPIAVFITKTSLKHVDIRKLKEAYHHIQQQVLPAIKELYHTCCPNCGNKQANVTHYIWDKNSIRQIWLECSNCNNSKIVKVPDENDILVAKNLDTQSFWYPNDILFENSRINAKKNMKVSDLFTNRALIALSILIMEIEKLDDTPVKEVLRLCFSAMLPQASNMVFVIKNRGKKAGTNYEDKIEVGSWVIGYWVPSEHFEINVWRCFENRFKRIIKGVEDIYKKIPKNVESYQNGIELIKTHKTGYFVNVGTATDMPLASESIDYVFTDPPHGNRIPYLELSLMWNSWLKFSIDWNQEIIISESKERDKNIADYNKNLSLAINEIWRVLKPDKYMSIAFNSLDDATWYSLMSICFKAGFSLEEIKPLQYSAHSVVQDNRKNALKVDLVITFRKTESNQPFQFFNINNLSRIENLIRTYLEINKYAQTYDILSYVIIEQARQSYFVEISKVLSVLNNHFLYQNPYWRLKG